VWRIWRTLPDPTVRALAEELGVSVTRAQQLLTAARLQIVWRIWRTLPDPTVGALAEELGVSVTRAQKLLTAARAHLEPDTSASSEPHASESGEARQG
jgi:plasmid maintenance system antidote protein VapI